jgi:hypothetical protein
VTVITVERDSRHARLQTPLLDPFSLRPRFRRAQHLLFSRNHGLGLCTLLCSLRRAGNAHLTVETDLSSPDVITDGRINDSLCADPSSTDCIHPSNKWLNVRSYPACLHPDGCIDCAARVPASACPTRCVHSTIGHETEGNSSRRTPPWQQLSRLRRNSSDCDPSPGIERVRNPPSDA